MLYDNLPGIELTIQDRGLILPAEQAPTATVLIIAPITDTPAVGTYTAEEYNPARMTGQLDFEAKNMGVFNTSNPMARLWKQVYDAGCRDIKVIKLKGADNAERYGHLHDIFYALEENIDADIILVGGVYVDDTVTGTVEFGFDRADYAISVISANANYSSVVAEVVGTGNGNTTAYTLDAKPILKDTLELNFVAPGTAPIFDTGNITAITGNDAGKTLIFKGVTATLKTAAGAVPAAATAAIAGSATLANGAAATAAILQGIDVLSFDFSGVNGKTFTVAVDGGAAQPVILDTNVTNIAGLVSAIDGDLDINVVVTNSGDKLVLTSATTGLTSSIVVAGVDAALFFGTGLEATGTADTSPTAPTTAAGFKAIFDAIKAAYPSTTIAGYTFTVNGNKLIITGTIAVGSSDNAEVITGTVTIVNTTNNAQLITAGVGQIVEAILTSAYTVDPSNGTIEFDTAPAAGKNLVANYKAYAYNYASQLAGFCEIVSAKNMQVLGVVALKPAINNNITTIKAYVEGQTTQFYSKYLQVVGGSTLYFSLGSAIYEDVWSGAYAGLISVLPSYSAPTAKAIPGVLMPSYNLSPTQILSLINKHVVTPRVRNGRVTVAESITTSDDLSDFVRLTTLRIVNDTVSLVREIAEPYIGEPNTVPRRAALDTAIRSGLTAMVNRGALNDFRFYIKSSIADQIDGTMRILLDIVPVFETRNIFISIAVKPML